MRRLGIFLFLVIVSSTPAANDAADRAMSTIRPEAIRADMRFLSDSLLEGRQTGTRGHEIAAKFMAAQFEELGLEPAGNKGTYFQSVPFRGSHTDESKTTMSWTAGGKEEVLSDKRDFLATPDPGRADTSVEAPVVFVGNGITAPELHHDDYQGIDAKGKIVAVIYGAPPRFDSSLRAHYSSGLTKRDNAVAHGAVGYVTLYDPDLDHRYSFQHRVNDSASPDLYWLDPQGHPDDYHPELRAVGFLSVAASRKFFEAAGHSADDIFAGAKAGKLSSFDTPLTFKIHVTTKSENLNSPNVVAKLPGSDPALRGEYVVFTAHLDHMGIGVPVQGDTVYHGALDNASGSAELLAIARAMVTLSPRPRRSILFVSVTAEEEGLLGADYFAHYPTVPKSALVADVNMDEDLMLWPLQDIVAYGAEHSSLGHVVQDAAERLHLTVSPDPEPEEVIFIRSDQYAFVKQGIPAFMSDAGDKSDNPAIQPEKIEHNWKSTIYHSPQDSMNQPGLDFEAGAKFAQFNFLCGYLVAQQQQRPVWNTHDFFGDRYAKK
jgi:hypothetical protein